MNTVGVTRIAVTQVMGYGIQKEAAKRYRGAKLDATLLQSKVEVVIGNLPVNTVVEATEGSTVLGHIGDNLEYSYTV